MAWFKADDKLYGHPKWLATSKGGRALWITAGTWSGDQLTDGFVPRHVLPMLDGTAREAASLVASGLWHEVDGGWQFHDWADHQPSREAVLDRRSKDAERLRKWRERKAAESGSDREGDANVTPFQRRS